MRKIDFKLKSDLDCLLKKQLISGKILLDRLGFLDESSRKAPAYTDPNYAPFYYHLGKFVFPKTFLSFNFSLGLLESSFLQSCRTVEYFFGFRSKSSEYYSTRLGNFNLGKKIKKDFYIGNFRDDEFIDTISSKKWDFVLVNEESSYDKCLEYLEFIWPHIPEYGIIVGENLDNHAFLSFCESVNRNPFVFETRYRTGIVQK